MSVSRLVLLQSARSALLVGLCVVFAPIVLAQTIVPQGASPISGTIFDVQSGDLNNGMKGTVTGAIQSVLPDPVNPNVIYIGATNGGVWKTVDGGQNWTPLTDKQVSLSVGQLAFDPTDQTGQKLYAAMGATSSGRIANIVGSGQLPGILYSPDGGVNWLPLAGTPGPGLVDLQNKSLIGVVARGTTLLAAADLPNASVGAGGLFRSTDGGKTFNDVTPGGALPAGAGVTSLVSDSTRSDYLYTAVSGRGIYFSRDTGKTWDAATNFPPIGPNQSAKLATGPGGSVVAAVYGTYDQNGTRLTETDGTLINIYLSLDNGTSWKPIGSDAVNKATTYSHLALAIGKNNPNIVYLAGDVKRQGQNKDAIAVGAFRLTLNTDGSTSFAPLTESGTANDTTVHPDARAFAFDASGRLLLGTDGGIYLRTSPATSGGVWTGLNSSSLQVGEIYSIAYDSRSHRLLIGLQDTGVGFQANAGGVAYDALYPADGLVAAVNDKHSSGNSILYYSAQSLGPLLRRMVDKNGAPVGDTLTFVTSTDPKNPNNGVLNFNPADFTEGNNLPFHSKLILNKNNPSYIAIGTNFVYTTTDELLVSSTEVDSKDGLSKLKNGATPLANRVSNQDPLGGLASAMSYGTRDNIDALLVGAPNGLFLTTSATTDLSKVSEYGGSQPISVVFDYNSSNRFFAADGKELWHLMNNGATVTATAHANDLRQLSIINPTALEFISNYGVNALIVGGALSGGIVAGSTAQSPLAAVNVDPLNGGLSGWTSFGKGLPNVLISQLSYNDQADVLAIGTFGRGAWLLYDTTAYFPTATALRFGLADNDSTPDAAFLANGSYASRDLMKVGLGTLTVAGTASYSGATTVSGGTMVVNGSIASSSGLTVEKGATLSGAGIVPTTTVMGTIAPGRPANAPATLRVNGEYTQANESTYQVLVNAAGQSDRIAVNGIASIKGGALQVVGQRGGLYAPHTTYTLLNATGGIGGSFSSASFSLGSSFLQSFVTSDAGNIFLNVSINGFRDVAETPVQEAVGGAIDSSVYSATGDYATVLGALANLDPTQVPAVLTSLSGMNYSGFSSYMVQSAQLFMANFLAQAGGASRGSGKLALAEACDVAYDAREPAKWGVWGGALGGLGTVGAGEPVGGVTYNLGGFAAGLDRRITDNALVGVAVGYAGGTQWVSGFSGQGYSDTVFVGLYGSYAQGPVYLDALAGYAYTSNRLTRGIVVPGLAPRTATGQTGANAVYGQLEGGYRFHIGTAADAYVTPFARLQAYTGTQGAITESGAQSLSLNVAAQTTDSLRTVVGAQIGGAIDLGWREKLAVQLRLGWGHEFADTNRPVTASFVGAPTAPFTTYGIEPQRDSVVIGLAASTAIADATSVYLRYEASITGQDSSHALTAGLRMTW